METHYAMRSKISTTLACVTTLLITTLLLGIFAPSPSQANAAELSEGWQQYGTCEWQVDENWMLVIQPLGGATSGTLPSMDGRELPWQGLYLTSVEVKPGVKAGESLYGFFAGLQDVTSMDLSGLDTSNTTDMSNMFWDCRSLKSLDLSGLNTSRVVDMSDMFYDCYSLKSLNFDSATSRFSTSSVKNMNNMFYDCRELTTLDLSCFNTSQVTDMGNMFKYCYGLKSLKVSSFNTSKVTNMNDMFGCCQSLSSLDLSSFDTSNVTDMGYMFDGCSTLASLNVSKFNTSKVTNMSSMFSRCSSLKSLDLSKLNTSNVADMSWMFAYDASLTSLNLSGFNTSHVTNMRSMFNGCESLAVLNLSSFDTSGVNFGAENATDPCLFLNCDTLREITVGAKFSLKGAGKVSATLPAPNPDCIKDANGYWYNASGVAYMPNAIPSGKAATYYAVNPKAKSISSLSISVPNKTYTGKAITPVTIKDGAKTLKNGTDYIVSYSNNTKVGTATAVITGMGSYTGKVTKTFKITKANISKAKVSFKAQTYTGKNLKPKPTVKLGTKTLNPKTDYTVTYNKKNNVKAGKATVIIKGKGNYSGSVNASFNIAPAKVTGVKASSTSKGKITVKWSNAKGKAANATGYKIVVKSGSKTIKTQYVSGKSAKSKTISLASKYKGKKVKTYVYAYKTIGKTKVCSPASSASTVKVKK